MFALYIPCPSKEEAEKIAKELLQKKLIACANIFPISSLYLWKGKIEERNEFVLLVKTNKEVEEEVKKLHSYENPCIGKIPIEFNKEYSNWLQSELK